MHWRVDGDRSSDLVRKGVVHLSVVEHAHRSTERRPAMRTPPPKPRVSVPEKVSSSWRTWERLVLEQRL